ncbi:MAG: MBL fold metallo-hydrolase [Chitinophagaceae bacterium]|jgi:glyoxylase-like metal-dependent hydrolase (beta-lactamase superfamily II)|nr:MBL fold metallo-hydrolase [Chitinophagaceae bacterium]
MLQIAMFTFSPIQENTYLLYNGEGQAALIDPGCYFPEEREQLSGFIAEKGLEPAYLLQTHCHLDHVFGLKWAAGQWGLTPHIHPNEEMVLQFAPASGKMWNLPFENYEGPLQWLTEGQEIRLGSDTLQVLFAPGHSPGHVCFYCATQGFVIGGDVLFQRSIGRTDLPGGSHSVLIESIRSQLFTLPDDTVVYPGHGPATTIGEEKRHNPFLQ